MLSETHIPINSLETSQKGLIKENKTQNKGEQTTLQDK